MGVLRAPKEFLVVYSVLKHSFLVLQKCVVGLPERVMKRDSFSVSDWHDGRRVLKILRYNDQTPFTFRLNDDWDVTYLIGFDEDNKVVIKEVSLQPAHGSRDDLVKAVPGGGVSKDLMKSIPLREDLSYIRSILRAQKRAARHVKKRSAGQRGAPRKDRRAILARYRQLCRNRTATPMKQLAREFGMTLGGMSATITRCRKRGELP